MQNFMKTIISAVKAWTDGRIQESVADWNENDSGKDSYIKNKPFYEEFGKTVVLVDNLTSADYDIDNPPSCNFVPGQTYNIIWNGKLYETVCHFDGEFNIIADNSLGCPFYIDDDGGNALYIESDDGDWTVSISTVQKVVHKLDSKYLDLPTNIATTDDIEDALDTVGGYIDNALNTMNENINTAQSIANAAQSTADAKMDKNNPVGTGSFSMNRKSGTTVGKQSHAEGANTTASGSYAHAEGMVTKATGTAAHAEGSNCSAEGAYSHAEGYGGGALGECAHAEGFSTFATAANSHSEGQTTNAYSENQHVQGKFNIIDSNSTYAHIVGNGTSATARSNAHTLDWNGVGWFQGGLQVGGTAQDDGAQTVMLNGDKEIILASSTEGSTKKFKLTIDDNGVLTASEIETTT